MRFIKGNPRPAFVDVRTEFPGLAQSTYLNSCAHGLLPKRTRAAIDRHLQRWTDDPNWDAWNEAIEAARVAFARLIGAHVDEIALQANASSGIASVMNAIHPKSGGRIFTCDLDFPTAPALAERQTVRGFAHDHLKTNGFTVGVDTWGTALGTGATLACIPSVASFNGYRFDIKEFAKAAHAADTPILVDAFQGAGTYPIDVHASDIDFLVTGTYKWLMGPVGLAFLYVRRDHHGLVPTTSGWYAQDAPYAFDPLGDLAKDANRFQYGGANILGAIAYAESAKLLEEVGIPNVEAHNRKLVERVMSHARDRKFEVLTPEGAKDRASIVTFRVPDLDKALAACAREKVMVNSRLGGIRVSPHFYNSAADVDRLFEVLDATR